MGKRLPLSIAIIGIASVAHLQLRLAAAQILAPGDTTCPSGIYSSVDGSCLGDQSQQDQTQTLGQQANPQAYPQTNQAYPGQGLSPSQLSQQYPGLQPQGMNGAIPSFFDQSGLTPAQAALRAQYEARQLAVEIYTPPTEFQQLVRASIGKLLPIYGDSLFRRVPSSFAPLNQVPVPASYVIGPGDQLVIRIWGQVNYNAQITVDRSGSVYLPQVGEIHVAGLQYSQLQQHLHDQLGRIYRNFNLDVELGQLRSIQVFVVGQARRPGSYTLSSLSTLVTAIFSTGGPSVQGSLRDIQVRRDTETITHFDLYDLLIDGEKSKDVPLLPGDVIYIPPVGPQVAVTGSVHNPAIYELKGATSLSQILRFAGGLSATASLLHASLERVDAHKDRTVVDLTLEGADLETALKDGDVLRVIPISPEFQKTVTLRGNVAEPGRFSWHPGMRLSEILPDTRALLTRDYWERRNQLGIPGPEFKPEYAVNPDLYPRNAQGYPRTSQYYGPGQTYNGQQPQYGNQNYDQNYGQNYNPNYNPGYNPSYSPNYSQNYDQNYVPNMDDGQGGDLGQNYPPSSGGNTLPYPQGTSQGLPPQNRLGSSGLAVSEQAARRAGNPPTPPLNIALPVPEIDWSYAVIERLNRQTLTASLVPFNLGKLILDRDASQDLSLQAGDVVTIFSQADISVPQGQRTKFVRLEGEIKEAGIYSVSPGETLRELVVRAGGLTPDAYLFGSEFTRESTREIQQQRLNDYLSNLELEIDRSTISSAASSITPQDTAATAAQVAASQSLVSKFRLMRATGRVVLNIPPAASGVDRLPDLPLEDGDRFEVPSKPSTVNVVGAVYDQNSFLFHSRQQVGNYLRFAGGPTRDADGKHAFVIRADGSVVSRQTQNGVFGNTFAEMRLNPGDTVVVPEKVATPSPLRNFINISQLFSQLALGVAAIAILQ